MIACHLRTLGICPRHEFFVHVGEPCNWVTFTQLAMVSVPLRSYRHIYGLASTL